MKMITKETNSLTDIDFSAGQVLLIDKDSGMSSFHVISRVRRIINIKKVGHAGTLDPFATGLLIICTGKQTKQIYKYQGMDKTYTGIISLGKTTPSMDTETEFSSQLGIDGITEENVLEARDKFLGEITQIPPMYSALKHKGQPLYKLARKGIEIERKPREITITDFEITKIDFPDVHFKICCSKGTYIRVIADDFGKELKCGGYLKKLRRTKIGDYDVDNALTIDCLRRLDEKKND